MVCDGLRATVEAFVRISESRPAPRTEAGVAVCPKPGSCSRVRADIKVGKRADMAAERQIKGCPIRKLIISNYGPARGVAACEVAYSPQAGRTAGIVGEQSGLIAHLFEMLRHANGRRDISWLLIENVSNMLRLDKGRAMAYLVGELDRLGLRWAYRVVDSRAVGVPQRRRRVLLLASPTEDPRGVLFADESEGLDEAQLSADAFGFYWTEGRTGLGWAQDAIPTLKGGSSVGIPSPPAIWLPDAEVGRKFVTPTIGDAEALQGFTRGWTRPAAGTLRNGPRWKLVGNAVTVGVAAWAASRIADPGDYCASDSLWSSEKAWPNAAWGENGKVWSVAVSEFPKLHPYKHLREVISLDEALPLSHRAAAGFCQRLQESNLGRYPGFRHDIAEHVQATGA